MISLMPVLTEAVVPVGTLAGMSQPALRAEPGLLLRPWNQEDVPTIVEAYADPAIQHVAFPFDDWRRGR